ncbi:MAG: class I SAM-dependent methyltransferase [Flavobacteriales bacterium]|nr:class I SAM-dependent methyltransferase [Flavobacteriales bacterium]
MLDKVKTKATSIFVQATHGDIAKIKRARLTYLKEDALLAIKKEVQRIEAKQVPGILLEAGCALGGSAILMGLNKSGSRNLRVYDVFGMIPAPSERDDDDVQQRYETIRSGQSRGIDGGKYYGYEEDLYTKVSNSFDSCGVPAGSNHIDLIKGLFEDTLDIDQPVALAHIDCDWYDSVMTCLERILPQLSPGGVAIIDDYYIWSGCRKATDDYLAKHSEFKTQKVARKLHITRK